MNRRSFLAALGATGLAGCTALPGSPTGIRTGSTTGTGTRTGDTATAVPLARLGDPDDICSSEVVDVGIEAIISPAFAADWSGVDVHERYGSLEGDAVVVGVKRGSRARAYPVDVLWHHEVVNDVVPTGRTETADSSGAAGESLLVTYCPVCSSGLVAGRRLDDAASTVDSTASAGDGDATATDGTTSAFGVSGQLWRPPGEYAQSATSGNGTFGVTRKTADGIEVRADANLVMYDAATGSFWSQLLARAICGPLRGTTLPLVPSTTATWGEWRRDYPDTDVMLPPPHSRAGNPTIRSEIP